MTHEAFQVGPEGKKTAFSTAAAATGSRKEKLRSRRSGIQFLRMENTPLSGALLTKELLLTLLLQAALIIQAPRKFDRGGKIERVTDGTSF